MNKVCVVTGGAAGIGRCIVEMFAESGYTVYFIDKTPEAVGTGGRKDVGKRAFGYRLCRLKTISVVQVLL